jgi:para-nitrobenzyl esterase
MQQIMTADSAYRVGKPLKDRLDTWGMPEMIPWSPVVDGTLVTGQPSAGYAAGMPAKPYLFGMNLNEGVLFAGLVEQALTKPGFSIEYDTMLSYLYGANNVSQILEWKTSTGYRPYSNIHDTDSTTHYMDRSETALSNVLGDALFHCGNLAAANAVVAQPDSLPVLAYLFAEPPVFDHGYPSTDGCLPQAGNVCHTYELPYVFNTFAYADSAAGSITPTAADSSLARAMPVAWAYFATHLAPPVSVWKPYTTNGGLYVWGGPTNGSMIQGWNNARNCTALWANVPPRG